MAALQMSQVPSSPYKHIMCCIVSPNHCHCHSMLETQAMSPTPSKIKAKQTGLKLNVQKRSVSVENCAENGKMCVVSSIAWMAQQILVCRLT